MTKQLLQTATNSVNKAAGILTERRDELRRLSHLEDGGREVKLAADQVMNDILLKDLQETGLPILSEEAGRTPGTIDTDLEWVVDPLDGSVNFLRGLDYCAISVGLCRDGQPIAGLIYDLAHRKMLKGVVGEGATFGDEAVTPSSATEIESSIISTGIPARMELGSDVLSEFIQRVCRFRKVRMFGSAAQSLLLVATGSVDAYYEKDIMLWDVAAGLAIVEAAGGYWTWKPGRKPDSRLVWASAKGLEHCAELFLTG